MKIFEIQQRDAQLLQNLYNIWEASVKATHSFLSKKEIQKIAAYVPKSLQEVPHLIVAANAKEMPSGFMGITDRKIEMLFLAPQERGKGLGKRLIQYGVDHYSVDGVAVNEQNPQALGFYQHMGFQIDRRSDFDEQGNPYPLLHLKLRPTSFPQKDAQNVQNIRPFQIGDIDALMTLWLEGNLKAHAYIPSDYWINNYDAVKKELPQATVYVYEQDHQILGFIGLTGQYIAGIFVHDEMQSKGIGKQLLDFVKRNNDRLTLHVYQKNYRAVAFYRREQFSVTAQQIEEHTQEIEYAMTWQR